MDEPTREDGQLTALTAEIVAAYVAHHAVPAAELTQLIISVHAALKTIAAGQAEIAAEPTEPAVPVKKSVKRDHIVCLEDGKNFKSLKRHLATKHDLTPAQYREKWGLPRDYPMVAPDYAAARSALAKKLGLGRKRVRRK